MCISTYEYLQPVGVLILSKNVAAGENRTKQKEMLFVFVHICYIFPIISQLVVDTSSAYSMKLVNLVHLTLNRLKVNPN